MSKLSQDLELKKRVKENQHALGELEDKSHEEKYRKVMSRIAQSDRRRQDNMNKKH